MIILTTAPATPPPDTHTANDVQAALIQGYLPVLKRIGRVIIVNSTAEIDLLFHRHRAEGEDVVFVSFTHPAETPRNLDCPTACIFSWARDYLPDTPLHALPDGSTSPSWQEVLSDIEAVITPRKLIADLLGGVAPTNCQVLTVAFPVAEYLRESTPKDGWAFNHKPKRHQFTDVALDTHVTRLRPENGTHKPVTEAQRITRALWNNWKHEVRLPRVAPDAPTPARVTKHSRRSIKLSGVVFTSVVNPLDESQNWPDIASAFCWAFRNQQDATLILNMTHPTLEHYQDQLQPQLALSAPFRCRVLVLHGQRQQDEYLQLIQASHYYVHASSADALCPAMMDFMCSGKPVIAPMHTAAADFLHPDAALILTGCQQPAPWPNDPSRRLLTFEHRLNWQSLVDAYQSAYEVAKHGPYQTMSKNARQRMEDYCSVDGITSKLAISLKQVAGDLQNIPGDATR